MAATAALTLLIGTAGCADMMAGPARPVFALDGRIAIDGRPLRGGWVEFWPVDGTVGDLRSAPIREDGSFRVDRLGPGRRVVRVVRPRIDGPLPAPLAPIWSASQRIDSPARIAIPEATPTRLDIDLATPDSGSGR